MLTRRLPWLGALIVLGLVAVVALRQDTATGTQPAPAPTPEPTSTPVVRPTVIPPAAGPAAGWRTFTHPQDKYRFDFPPGWHLTTFGKPNETITLTNYEPVSGRKPQGSMDQDIKVHVGIIKRPPSVTLQEFLASQPTDTPDTGTVRSTTPATVASKPALKRVIAATDPPGNTWTSVSLWFEREPGTFIAIGYSPGNSVHSGDFWRLVESFQLVE